MTTHYYNRSGCGGGCLLLLFTIILLPFLLLVRLLSGRPVTFGGGPGAENPPAPSGDEPDAADDVVDIEAKEVEASTRRIE
ncbi:MAG: hypothetical protein PHI85_09545 [Victivallaceae bacterium]|nr:hypothetical protein [Victivallaceae bacterium]